ncbi:ATP-binding protein [Spongiibacter tropicus]|uniref:ATP-binding protein n=1 Tax=Spongiibacter tropicus TaxID=454602 RepID=UPI002593626D|nr:ATP-binding protein [uncultured Spongiibacter sp.]|tara:strand:+ start:3720 stop:4787 length:1068 start_codon:yes stop_codon:yes gene_type:complete
MDEANARIDKIKGLRIQHRNWTRALSESFALLTVASPGDVICITGPSRAGKSRLIQELVRLLCGEDRFYQTGLLPAVVVEAVNSGPNGLFATKAFTQRMLDAVKHPILSVEGALLDVDPAVMKAHRTTEAALRLALERALRARKTRFLFIDEAQHVRYVSKTAMGGYAVLDSWKCLAKDAGVVLVVVGAYPLLDILNNSPHLLGRKNQVHLPRYSAVPDDIAEFGRILAHYDQLVDLGVGCSSLVKYGQLLYEGSVGCIGLLRKWLLHASVIASSRSESLSESLLLETRPPAADIEAISREIAHGETYLSNVGSFEKPKGARSRSMESRSSTAPKRPFQKKPRRLARGNRKGPVV